MGKKQIQKEEYINEMRNFLLRTLLTGFIGGLLLWMSWAVFTYFNFVEFDLRTIILSKWKEAEWVTGWVGSIITIGVTGILSIIISFLYYILLKKINSLWAGIIYGAVIWILTFLLIGQLFPEFTLNNLESETVISTLSLFVLYGMFVGYSISYDFYRIQLDMAVEQES